MPDLPTASDALADSANLVESPLHDELFHVLQALDSDRSLLDAPFDDPGAATEDACDAAMTGAGR